MNHFLSLLVAGLCAEAGAATFSTNPVSLTLRGVWECPAPANYPIIRVVPPRAYLNSDGRIYLLDVSNPELPVELGHYQGAIDDFQVIGNRLYIVQANDHVTTNGVLKVIDASNATNLALIGTIATRGRPNRLAVKDSFAYVAEQLQVGPDSLGVMEVFCVSNPASPFLVGQFETNAPIYDIKLTDHFAYLADGNSALTILDTSNPANPYCVGAFHTNDPYGWNVSGRTVEVKDGRVYVSTDSVFFILDVRDPTQPPRVSNILRTVDDEGRRWDYIARPADRFVCLAKTGRFSNNVMYSMGATFYDMSDPFNWLEIGFEQIPETVTDLQLVDGRAYLAAAEGLMVCDISVLPYFRTTTRSGDKLVLSWPGEAGLRLQRNSSLTSPDWTDVPESEGKSRMEVPVGAGAEFFRLVKP